MSLRIGPVIAISANASAARSLDPANQALEAVPVLDATGHDSACCQYSGNLVEGIVNDLDLIPPRGG
jgi:ribulose 1,5-bisphosphate synthetase/thiazole synthase